MGKRGPIKGSKYNTSKNYMKSRVVFNISNDLKAWIKKVAKELNITESMLMDNVIRKYMMSRKDFLIWNYKNALREVESYRHLLVLEGIQESEIMVENETTN